MSANLARIGQDSSVDEVDRLRGYEYALLSRLLASAPDRPLLDLLAGLQGDDTPLGRAHGELAAAAATADPAVLEREFFSLFIGVGRGELLPYASFYRTGFLNERPLAAVRKDMLALGLERAGGLHDPEDHIAILFDVMAMMARGECGEAVSEADFFTRHIEPWAPRLFEDLAGAPSAVFYRKVAALGAAFTAVEAEAFRMDRS